MKHITVLVVDDHAIVREGIRKMLELENDLSVVGEAKDGHQAVAMANSLRPEVILMDIAMPGLNGLEATRQVIMALPETKVIILTAHHDDAYLTSAMASGAVGFLLKQTSAQNVCRAIREVRKGNTFFGKSVTRRLAHLSQQAPRQQLLIGKKSLVLTTREVEVLQLIAGGKTNPELAEELGISVKTVELHRGNLMEKLGIHDTASLTRYAISAGIVENRVRLTII